MTAGMVPGYMGHIDFMRKMVVLECKTTTIVLIGRGKEIGFSAKLGSSMTGTGDGTISMQPSISSAMGEDARSFTTISRRFR